MRSALLVAGLAGLGRITPNAANSLNRRYGLGLGRQSSWTRMIDAAARLRQAGTVLVLDRDRLPDGATLINCPAAHVYHAIAALEAHRPGLHRADDRGRGAVADVTAEDRGAGRSFPRHDGGRSRRFAAHARRLPQRPGARGRGGSVARSATASTTLSRLGAAMGASWRRRPLPGGRRRCGGSSASLSMTAFATTTRRPPCRGPGSSGRCRASSMSRKSPRMFEAAEDRAASGEADGGRATSPCSNCSMARGCARASWSACRAARCAEGSRS